MVSWERRTPLTTSAARGVRRQQETLRALLLGLEEHRPVVLDVVLLGDLQRVDPLQAARGSVDLAQRRVVLVEVVVSGDVGPDDVHRAPSLGEIFKCQWEGIRALPLYYSPGSLVRWRSFRQGTVWQDPAWLGKAR